MSVVFADTSFYIALVNPNDDIHTRAVEFRQQYMQGYVTTEFVLIELGNWLRKPPRNREVFLKLVDQLYANRQTEIVPANDSWLQSGFALYRERLDKHWSLTDCISFAVMQARGITDAASADRDFQQAGFHPLLA